MTNKTLQLTSSNAIPQLEHSNGLAASCRRSWTSRRYFVKNFRLQTKIKNRESLLKGKDQYRWPPCTNLFRSAPFDNANVYFFTKQATLMRRSTVFNLPLQLVFLEKLISRELLKIFYKLFKNFFLWHFLLSVRAWIQTLKLLINGRELDHCATAAG